jgi:hypothetical protein
MWRLNLLKYLDPILQIKYKFPKDKMVLKLLLRYAYTVRTQGELSSTYYSEELYNAEKIGYKYSIKSGYLFEKFDVFSKFIPSVRYEENLYQIQIKEASNKDA